MSPRLRNHRSVDTDTPYPIVVLITDTQAERFLPKVEAAVGLSPNRRMLSVTVLIRRVLDLVFLIRIIENSLDFIVISREFAPP